jgi:hypothetical protein
MNFSNKRRILTFLICSLSALSLQAKYVAYSEDAYFAPAPQELLDMVAKIAALAHYDKNYEVMVPKKAGIQINPANKFIGSGFNPQSKNAFISLNPEWFMSMPQESRDFLLARCFATFELGTLPSSFTMLSYLFIFLSLLALLLSFFLLGKTRLARQRIWIRILIAAGIAVACELIVLDRVHNQLKQQYADQHNLAILHRALELTGNREAAIQTLELYDAAIKAELKNGEQFWAPYEHLFEKLANELKK